jgi:hypothetical protein
MLGLLALSAIAGCESGPVMLPRPPRPSTSALGLAPAAAAPAEEALPTRGTGAPGPSVPAEPIAAGLVAAIVDAVPDRATAPDGWTVVGLGHLRNHSHAAEPEFRALVARLAEALAPAGIGARVRFVANPSTATQYELAGTAYLITADGFDQWEIFLRLSPADDAWTLRTWDEPLRVLRHPRAGQPQLTRGPTPR